MKEQPIPSADPLPVARPYGPVVIILFIVVFGLFLTIIGYAFTLAK